MHDARNHRDAIIFHVALLADGGYTARAADGMVVEGPDLITLHERIRRVVATQVPDGAHRSVRVVFPAAH
ncbi:MAG: hypothetical protein Kow0010_13590 [Dehalococcoidia bacterium]